MRTLLRQRVANYDLAPSHALYPLFEAISNSLFAIEDRFGEDASRDGRMEIRVIRSSLPPVVATGSSAFSAVETFEITDNGVGFDDRHMEAFKVSDTDFRKAKGGKGIGRLSWLVAFKRATVDSVYFGPGGKRRRSFTFTLDHEDGVDPDSIVEEEVPEDAELRTTVRLDTYQPDFQKYSRRSLEALARHVVDHCLDYFALGNAPEMRLVDGDEDIDLNGMFDSFESRVEEVTVPKGFKLTVRHFLIRATRRTAKHLLGLVAARRRVTDIELDHDNVFDLPKRLTVEGQDETYVYVGYAHGDLLDRFVNGSRTRFNLPSVSNQDDTIPCQRDVDGAVLESANAYLAPFLKPITEAKLKEVEEYVSTERPRWLHLLKNERDKIVKEVRGSMSKPDLDVALYRIDADHRARLAVEHKKLLREIAAAENGGPYREQMDALLDRIDQAHKAALVDYVVQRKVLLETIEVGMRRDASGRYVTEADIHRHIMPMGLSSGDHDFEARQNLWVLSERLAFHHWIGSDKQIRSSPLENTSQKEPDILSLIYDNRHMFGEGPSVGLGSITLVEFKRPERDDYTDDKNPIMQVWKYIEEIRSGSVKDKNGRTLPAATMNHIPFYGYVVCTFTKKLEAMARTLQFTRLPDREGYFNVHNNFNAYVEVISFDEMLRGAQQRNRIFFERLGLPAV